MPTKDMCHLIYSKRFFNDKVGFYKQGSVGLLWNSPLPIHIAKISMCHLGGGGLGAPQLLANNTFFSGFSHTIDRKVPSEVVILCQSYMVMSNKTAIFQLKSQ